MEKKYRKLSEMILFFNQRFHMEQLITYGYKFLQEKLELNNSCIYIKDNKKYTLRDKIGYEDLPYEMDENRMLVAFASLHGRLLTSSFIKYFDKEIIDTTNMTLVIPLIYKGILLGYIISDGLKNDDLNTDNIEFIESANVLINNAYQRISRDRAYSRSASDRALFSHRDWNRESVSQEILQDNIPLYTCRSRRKRNTCRNRRPTRYRYRMMFRLPRRQSAICFL